MQTIVQMVKQSSKLNWGLLGAGAGAVLGGVPSALLTRKPTPEEQEQGITGNRTRNTLIGTLAGAALGTGASLAIGKRIPKIITGLRRKDRLSAFITDRNEINKALNKTRTRIGKQFDDYEAVTTDFIMRKHKDTFGVSITPQDLVNYRAKMDAWLNKRFMAARKYQRRKINRYGYGELPEIGEYPSFKGLQDSIRNIAVGKHYDKINSASIAEDVALPWALHSGGGKSNTWARGLHLGGAAKADPPGLSTDAKLEIWTSIIPKWEKALEAIEAKHKLY